MNQKIGLWLTAATLILLAFVSFSMAAPAAQGSSIKAKDGERMVLVLDASGSMWGQIDGKPKIAIAKSVMAELVDELPEDLHVSLTVYPAGSSDKIRRATGGSPRFTLKPGAYDVRVRASQIKAETWLRGVTIEDGADIQQKVQF